jgi:predicted regulator of Ras-like GTPase activity (Roadblock/LC7/MglB family)
MRNPVTFTEEQVAACRKLLERLLATSPEFVAAFIATIDGRLMLDRCRREIGGSRVSSMASSLLALSEALGGELGMRPSSHVTVSAEAGTIVLLRVGDPRNILTLTTAARPGVSLGTLLAASRRAAAELAEICTELTTDLSESAGI